MRVFFKRDTARDWLIPAMLLLLGFGAFFSRFATMTLLYAVLFPLCFASVYRSLPEAIAKHEPTVKAALISCAVLLITLTYDDMQRVGWETVVTLLLPFFICVICLLHPPREMGERDVRRAVELFGGGMILLYLPLELIAMFCLYTDRVISLPLADGIIGVIHSGTLWDRLQILSHPNNVGQYAVFIIVFCLYFFRRYKKTALRVGLALDIVMNIIVLAHVQSRNDSTAVALAVVLFTFLTAREGALKKKQPLAAVLAVAAGLCVYFAIDIIYKLDTALISGASVGDIATRSDTYGKLDVVSTGRGAIWKWALGYFKAHPAKLLTGIGSDYYNIIAAEYPIADTFRSLHCSFLTCLVVGGIPFLACVIWLLLTLLKPVVGMLLRAERTDFRGLVIIPILIIVMFAMSQIESMLYINPHVNPCFQNLMFFALCGYARAFERLHPRNESGR